MGRKKCFKGFISSFDSKESLSQTLATELVKNMRSKSFPSHLERNKYLCMMHDGSLMFINDISFWKSELPVLETKDLILAMKQGEIGELVRRVTDESCKRN